MEAHAKSLSQGYFCGRLNLILVMVGTNPYPFTRLIEKVIEWAEKTGEHVIVQSGHTPVTSDVIEHQPFIEHSEILQLMNDAEVVITQGGFGSLQDCMKIGAKTIAVPRLIELGESQDDQTEIVNALAEENRVVPLFDVTMLADAIQTAKNMQIKTVKTNALPEHVKKTISEILDR